MKSKNTLFKGFKIPIHAFTVLSVILLIISTFLLFQDLKEINNSSDAFISNTWTVWGDNTNGQFCNGTTVGNPAPQVLQSSGNVVALAGGVDHVLALNNDNTVKACGDNSQGQLGNNSNTNSTTFVNVSGFPPLTNIIQVVAGNQISFALTNTGTVYQWGSTLAGAVDTPTLITGLTNITSITSSEKTLLALNNNTGVLFAYGLNANGESGNGNSTQITTPIIVDSGVSDVKCSKEACAIIKSGQVFTSGKNSRKELAENILPIRSSFGIVNIQRTPDVALTNITKLASGPSSYNFFALDGSGNVWSWGDASYLGYSLPGNIDGDLARQIPGLTNVSSISGGFPLAIRQTGSLFTWTNTMPTMITTVTSATKLSDSGSLTAYVKGNLFDPFDSTAISSFNINCSPAEVNQTTTCAFTLPLNKDLPNLFKIGIGGSTPGGNCSSSGTIVTCFNVPTGAQAGTQIIFGQISSNPKVATTTSVTVIPTIISDVNIAFQSGSCTPNPTQQGQTTNCTFPLIGSTEYGLPTNGLRAAITNISGDFNTAIGPSNPCIIITTNLNCNNIPTSLGLNLATIGTHEVIVYEPNINYYYNKATVSIQPPIINANNILDSSDCIDNVTVQIGNTYNCSFSLTGSPNNFYNLPSGGVVAKTSESNGDSPVCSLLNNGSPTVSLFCLNIPTVGSMKGVQDVLIRAGSSASFVDKGGITLLDNLNNVDLSSLNITCNDGVVNSTTTCNFTLPLFTLPPNLTLGIGDSSPSGTCTTTGNNVNCINVPTGSGKGQQIIYAQLPASTKVSTGNTVTLTRVYQNSSVPSSNFSCTSSQINTSTVCTFDIPSFETLDPGFSIRIGNSAPSTQCNLNSQQVTCSSVSTGSEAGNQNISAGNGSFTNSGEVVFITRSLNSGDLTNFSQFTSLICTPNPVAVFSTTTCTGTLPNFIVFGTTSLRMRVDNQFSVLCGIAGQVFTCANISVGATTGDKTIQASVDGGAFVTTGLSLVVSDKIIGDAEIANINVPEREQVLSEIKCGTNGIVFAGKLTTCTAKISVGWVIFPEFKFGVGVEPGGSCTQAGSNLTCINVPVSEDIQNQGVLFLVNRSGELGFTNILFSIQTPPDDFVYTPPSNNPTNNPTTPTPTAPNLTTTNSTSGPNARTSVTDTPRTGGVSVLGLLILWSVWFLLFFKIFFSEKLKINKLK